MLILSLLEKVRVTKNIKLYNYFFRKTTKQKTHQKVEKNTHRHILFVCLFGETQDWMVLIKETKIT